MTNMHYANLLSKFASGSRNKTILTYIFSASVTFVMQMIPALHLGPCAAVNPFLVRVNIAIAEHRPVNMAIRVRVRSATCLL